MKYDGFSTRDFFLRIIGYPVAVVEWMEIWYGGTGAFRGGFAQVRRPSFSLTYAYLSYPGGHLFFKSRLS